MKVIEYKSKKLKNKEIKEKIDIARLERTRKMQSNRQLKAELEALKTHRSNLNKRNETLKKDIAKDEREQESFSKIVKDKMDEYEVDFK